MERGQLQACCEPTEARLWLRRNAHGLLQLGEEIVQELAERAGGDLAGSS